MGDECIPCIADIVRCIAFLPEGYTSVFELINETFFFYSESNGEYTGEGFITGANIDLG